MNAGADVDVFGSGGGGLTGDFSGGKDPNESQQRHGDPGLRATTQGADGRRSNHFWRLRRLGVIGGGTCTGRHVADLDCTLTART